MEIWEDKELMKRWSDVFTQGMSEEEKKGRADAWNNFVVNIREYVSKHPEQKDEFIRDIADIFWSAVPRSLRG